MTQMTFEQQIERFFRGYSKEQRRLVEAHEPYQKAHRDGDIEKAERVAAELLEGNMRSKESARLFRQLRA